MRIVVELREVRVGPLALRQTDRKYGEDDDGNDLEVGNRRRDRVDAPGRMNGCTVSRMAMTTLKPKTTAKCHLSGEASSARPRAGQGASLTHWADRRVIVASVVLLAHK
jgi:hypothetical protein